MAPPVPATYPLLLDVNSGKFYPLARRAMLRVGQSPGVDVQIPERGVAPEQFRIANVEGVYYLELNGQSVQPTLLNQKRPAPRTLLQHADEIQVGNHRFQFQKQGAQAAAPPPPPRQRGPAVPDLKTVTNLKQSGPVVATFSPDAIQLEEGREITLGREAGRASVVLKHLHVSRLHTRVVRRGAEAIVRDMGSANGTYVNNHLINRPTIMRTGDRLDIGPFTLIFDGYSLRTETRDNNIELVGLGISRHVRNAQTGERLQLLDDVSLVVKPREFVSLIGPSGAGKSTLMAALSARAPVQTGSVLVNQKNLHANFELLKQDMAMVPQQELVHDLLTVREALYYTARLRLPLDLSRAQINERIDEMLNTVGLTKRQHTQVRNLSGGQKKRAVLANELLADPTLIFLDEVTSGLDEETDREMMALFQKLSRAGKTIVCITHNLGNVESFCDVVIILAQGGRLAYIGSPQEALTYFQIPKLGEVYKKLELREATEWRERYQRSPEGGRYLHQRLRGVGQAEQHQETVPPIQFAKSVETFGNQFRQLSFRYLSLQLADHRGMIMMALQCLLVALLLCAVFADVKKAPTEEQRNEDIAELVADMKRGEDVTLEVQPTQHEQYGTILFLIGVSSIWYGCNNSAREIVKEKVIYERERDVNLQVASYYCSKLILLGIFTVIQATTLFMIVYLWCEIPGNPLVEWGAACLLAVAGVTLGLAISARSPTSELAISLVPIALIPQIIMADRISDLGKVSELAAKVGVTVYWGNRATEGALKEEFGDSLLPLFMIGLHILVLIAFTLASLYLDARKSQKG